MLPDDTIFKDCHVAEEIEALKHHAHLGPVGALADTASCYILAVEEYLSAAGGLQEVDAAKEGGFAAAGRAYDAGHIALADVEIYVLEHFVLSEEFGKVPYFQNVLNWAITNFDMKKFKKIMKGLDWAWLYDKYGSETLDTVALAQRISVLMRDSEIQKLAGIIPFVLTGDERYLDLRAFPEDIKLAAWEKQNHICPLCGREFDYEFMEGDHITPWREGGRTVIENCQMLCRECNRRKGAK